MCRSYLFATYAIALLSLTQAFIPQDISAVFRRVGANTECPASITHLNVKGKRNTAQLVVEHRDISIGRTRCTSIGRLLLTPSSSNRRIPNHGIDLYRALLSDGSSFYTAEDTVIRVCGPLTPAEGTIYFFANTNGPLRIVEVNDVKELVFDTNYMIYAEPGGRKCVFKSIVRRKTAFREDKVCFPSDSTVQIEGGKTKRMDELIVGDRVLVGPETYSQVFMFTHSSLHIEAEFVEIRVRSGATVQLTPGHYLYVNAWLIAARDVQIGDTLVLGDGTSSAVVSAKYIMKRGIFNPQTIHGNIVVNGVTASTFTEAIEYGAAQSLLAPFRCLFRAFGIHPGAVHGKLVTED